MVCKNCDSQIPENETKCPKCSSAAYFEDLNISAVGAERAVPRGFSAKKNIIIIIIAALLALGVGGTAVALGISNMPANRVSRYMGAAERYLSEQNYEQAVIEFQRVLEIEPMNVEAYLGLADVYIAMGDTDKAAEILNKGFDQTGDNRLKTKLEALKPSSVQTEEALGSSTPNSGSTSEQEEPETAHPLTSADLSWLVEPTYEFDDVVPIQSDFSDLVVSSIYNRNPDGHLDSSIVGVSAEELSLSSYSYVEEYYQINIGDEYRIFYVPDRIISPFSKSLSYEFGEYGFSLLFGLGIECLGTKPEEASVYPWKEKIVTGGLGGLFYGSFFWDSYTSRMYLYEDSPTLTLLWLQPVTAGSLKKNHRVQCHDLGSLGDLLSDNFIEYKAENWGLYNDNFISPVYKPISPKYALWSPEDKLLTDFIYDDMCITSYGITAACRDGKWGYLDENGVEITEFIYDAPWVVSSSYDSEARLYSPQYGAFPCTSDTMVVSLNGQYGVLYKDGRTLIDFGQFEDLAPAWNNQLWAKQNGKWGLIDLGAAKQAFGIEANNG